MIERGNACVVILRDGTVFDARYMGALDTEFGDVMRFISLPYAGSSGALEWVAREKVLSLVDLGRPFATDDWERALEKVLK